MTRITLGLAVLAVAVGAAKRTEAAIIVLPVIEDSLINSESGINHNNNILASETTATSDYWGSWLKFDLSSLVGQQINSATLQLTTFFNHSGMAINHEVFSSSVDSWSETTITGLNQPGEPTLTSLDVTLIPAVNATYSWNVLGGVLGSDGLAGGNNLLTLFIRPQDLSPNVSRGPHFDSKDSGGANPPVLVVDAVPAVPVPELGSLAIWALASLGVASYGWNRRRRFRKQVA